MSTEVGKSSTKRCRLSPDQRFSQLINQAISIAERNHYQTVTHASIAEEANCSVPTVFNYFKSKEDLVQQICKHAYDSDNKKVIAQMVVSSHPIVSHLCYEIKPRQVA